MKEIKPTNETGKNPETEQEKEVLPSFFQTLRPLPASLSPTERCWSTTSCIRHR